MFQLRFFFCVMALLLSNGGIAQSAFSPDQLIIEYVQGTDLVDRVATRNLFNVGNYAEIDPGRTELWDVDLPLSITVAGITITINTIEELLGYIEGNNNGASQDDRLIINESDLNYELELDPTDLLTPPAIDPLPNCPNESYRVVGTPDLAYPNRTRIIVMDQAIRATQYFPQLVESYAVVTNNTGTHGNRVASVIKHTLEEAGMAEDFDLVSYAVFGDDGIATYADLLRAFAQIMDKQEQNAIINLSGSMEIVEAENEKTILESLVSPYLENNNILLISSVGNNGADSDLVMPACARMVNEISVAGSMNCFASPWTNTNFNSVHYDLVVEAEDVATFDGINFYLSSGTSFAAPLATAVAAQINSYLNDFNAPLIRETLLASADQVPQMMNIVNQGRVINATVATSNPNNGNALVNEWSELSYQQEFANTSEMQIAVSPNPFDDQLQLTFPADWIDRPVQLKLFHANGALVSTTQVVGANTRTWILDRRLPGGIYYMQMEWSGGIQQHQLIKQ